MRERVEGSGPRCHTVHSRWAAVEPPCLVDSLPRPISVASVPAHPRLHPSSTCMSPFCAQTMPFTCLCWPGCVSQVLVAGESGTGLRPNSRRAYRCVPPGPICGLRAGPGCLSGCCGWTQEPIALESGNQLRGLRVVVLHNSSRVGCQMVVI